MDGPRDRGRELPDLIAAPFLAQGTAHARRVRRISATDRSTVHALASDTADPEPDTCYGDGTPVLVQLATGPATGVTVGVTGGAGTGIPRRQVIAWDDGGEDRIAPPLVRRANPAPTRRSNLP